MHLLTNEHVASAVGSTILAHLPRPNDYYVICKTRFNACTSPYDVAAAVVDEFPVTAERDILVGGLFDQEFNPAPRELLFWIGYPGTTGIRNDPVTRSNTRRSYFGHLPGRGTSVLAQQLLDWPAELPSDFDPLMHVIVHYPSQARPSVDAEPIDLPNPHGMSGSLLWDTKRIAHEVSRDPWAPDSARICGIIWAAWPNPEVVAATKVEHLRRCLSEHNLPLD